MEHGETSLNRWFTRMCSLASTSARFEEAKHACLDRFINAMLKKMMSGSLTLVVLGYAASSVLMVATVCAAEVAFASPAAAALQTKRNAQGLLYDMRVSLDMIARSYKDASGARHRSTASVLEAVSLVARAAEQLEGALVTPNSKAIADATGSLSKAMGELQTRYALTASQNKQSAQGMRYLNAAWKSYAARYILSKPANETRTVSKGKFQALRERVRLLERRVASLEDQIASNANLQREVARLRQHLAYYDDRPNDYQTHQSMLLTLAIVSGSFDAFSDTTRAYYPNYHVHFQSINMEFEAWQSYWDGYYDGYYGDRNAIWYAEPAIVDGPLLEIDKLEIKQDISYQTIYNITSETRIEYEALPQEALADRQIPAPADDTILTIHDLAGPENDAAIEKFDETTSMNVELNDNSAKQRGEIDPRHDQTSDSHMPQSSEKLPDSAEPQQHRQNAEDVIRGNDQDDAADQSGDELQKRDVSSDENDSDTDRLQNTGQGSPQQIETPVDAKSSTTCSVSSDNC